MNLTEQNIREKTISELIFHSTYPETIQMDITSEGILDYIKLNRIMPIYSFKDERINSFLSSEKYRMRGNDINSYLFNRNLNSIEEILEIVEYEQAKTKFNETYFSIFTFTELIELMRIYEHLHKFHSKLLKNAKKELSIYDETEKNIKEKGEQIKGELLHNIILQLNLRDEVFEEEKKTKYYFESLKKIKEEIYGRLGINYDLRYDLLESKIREYFKAKKLVLMEDTFIKENYPNYTSGLLGIKEMTHDAKLMKKRF